MTKIKITEKEIGIEGTIEAGRVTPFGTSAHIPFKKKHTGKLVNVIMPEDTKYIWLITLKERKELLKSARKNIEKENGELRHYRLGMIEGLKKDEFYLASLIKVLEFADNKKLVKRIKILYNLV